MLMIQMIFKGGKAPTSGLQRPNKMIQMIQLNYYLLQIDSTHKSNVVSVRVRASMDYVSIFICLNRRIFFIVK